MYKQQHLVVKICMKAVKKLYYVCYVIPTTRTKARSKRNGSGDDSARMFWSVCIMLLHTMLVHRERIVWPKVYDLNWMQSALVKYIEFWIKFIDSFIFMDSPCYSSFRSTDSVLHFLPSSLFFSFLVHHFIQSLFHQVLMKSFNNS